MKGILFKPDMIKTIVEGKKTQTRRVMKNQPDKDGGIDACNSVYDHNVVELFARYRVGEMVYIKEAWCNYCCANEKGNVCYKYDDTRDGIAPEDCDKARWQNPLFMPAWTARTFIKITDVRPERLNNMTEEDAIAEGVNPNIKEHDSSIDLRLKFAWLWDSINKTYSFDSDPWVWRYEFEKI